jgi:hypothetical protein
MENLERKDNFRRPKEITSADDLTIEELQAIKTQLETVGFKKVNHLLDFLQNSLFLTVKVDGAGLGDETQESDDILGKKSKVVDEIIKRIETELGGLKRV